MQLSFGEQVKIVLKRQGITIKELASRIEEQTGKKMSRQNLTQRLGRDNFQEQDMFMVARALGCSLSINLIEAGEPEEPVRAAAPQAEAPEVKQVAARIAPEAVAESVEELEFEQTEMTEAEAAEAAAARSAEEFEAEIDEQEAAEEAAEVEEEAEAAEEAETEVDEAAAQPMKREVTDEEIEEKKSRFRPLTWYKKSRKHADEEEAAKAVPSPDVSAEPETAGIQDVPAPAEEESAPAEPEIIEEELSHEELMRELNADIAALGDAGTIELDDIPERGRFDTDPEAEQAFEREKEALLTAQKEDRNAELPADQLPSTSVNPYTLREYKSNTVRAHASRIGYVQVYSRKEHAWQDMTEWAFMGEQERRKTLLGDDYEEPTYLD